MELVDLTFGLLVFLFCIALTAGFIDTLAGGGGLLTLPALILSGLPPLFALGTNKFQSSMGSGTATYMMLSKKRIVFSEIKFKMLTAFCGSLCGTILIQFINARVLSFVIPIILLVIAVYFLISPRPLVEEGEEKISSAKYANLVIPSIGFYDGMFGPGTGSFFVLAGVALKGRGLVHSTAIAKSLNFATNIASLIIFLFAGKVIFLIGIIMMLGQGIGARIGSHFLFHINPNYLRYLIIIMCLGMLTKYAINAF